MFHCISDVFHSMALQTRVILQCWIEELEGQKKKRIQVLLKLILLPNSLCYQATLSSFPAHPLLGGPIRQERGGFCKQS